jgi:hypothetical protein
MRFFPILSGTFGKISLAASRRLIIFEEEPALRSAAELLLNATLGHHF